MYDLWVDVQAWIEKPTCPIHKVDMYYSKHWDQYGCQEIICPFSIGVSKETIFDYVQEQCHCVGLDHLNSCLLWVLPF